MTHVAAGEIVRIDPGSTYSVVAMLGNKHHPDKKSEQGWVHWNGRTVGWLAFDHKLVGKGGIARDVLDSFRYSRALDLEIVEPGSSTIYLKWPLRIVVGLDATFEKRQQCFGTLAGLRPFLTC